MTTETVQEPAKDARGIPITIGASVIYGAPVGRSIALVEGEVVGFTASGRVNIRVIRRAYGGWYSGRDVVHVGHDRLVIVNSLPKSTLPTDAEKHAQQKREMEERDRIFITHPQFTHKSYQSWNTANDTCVRCEVPYSMAHRTECIKT